MPLLSRVAAPYSVRGERGEGAAGEAGTLTLHVFGVRSEKFEVARYSLFS